MIALVAALLLAAPPAPPTQTVRFAVVVGNNDGGSDRDRLRWAVRDAERAPEAGAFPVRLRSSEGACS